MAISSNEGKRLFIWRWRRWQAPGSSTQTTDVRHTDVDSQPTYKCRIVKHLQFGMRNARKPLTCLHVHSSHPTLHWWKTNASPKQWLTLFTWCHDFDSFAFFSSFSVSALADNTKEWSDFAWYATELAITFTWTFFIHFCYLGYPEQCKQLIVRCCLHLWWWFGRYTPQNESPVPTTGRMLQGSQATCQILI